MASPRRAGRGRDGTAGTASRRLRFKGVNDVRDGVCRRYRRDERSLGQPIELLDLGWVEHLKCEVALCQRLNAGRIVELRPFGPQRRYGIALAPDLGGELRDAFGL